MRSLKYTIVDNDITSQKGGCKVIEGMLPKLSPHELTERELLLFREEVERRKKSPVATWMLWAFLGLFGAHRFYLGRVGTGIGMLFATLLTFCIAGFIWWIVDAFLNSEMLKAEQSKTEAQVLQELAAARLQRKVNNKGQRVSDQHYYESGTTVQDSTRVAIAKLVLPDRSEIVLHTPTTWVGKNDLERAVPPNDLQFISRRHFRIDFENGRYYIEDQGSTNGTKLNGAEIKGRGRFELKNGDVIEVANVAKLVFKSL